MIEFILECILFVLAAFIIYIAISNMFTFVLLYIDYNLNRLKDPKLYPEIPGKYFITQSFKELMYVIGKFYKLPFAYMNLTLNVKRETPVAILLIHGYARNQSDWLWFRKQIADLDYPIYTVNLAPALATIPQITNDSLVNKIAMIRQQTDCKKIILIGHSMGGLVSSYYSEYLDTDNLITSVITIATPYHGTRLSITAVGENAKQMLPYATFTAELREKIAKSHKIYYQVATHFDNIIVPWQSSLLPETAQTQQLVMSQESHLSLLHSKEVVQQVKAWVKSI